MEKDILKKHGSPTADALVESAIRHINILDELNFYDIKISVKSSNVKIMQEAYRKLGEQTDYPLHLGVTEAGTYAVGSVKSAIGIGSLISEGLGDTIRVSLTDDPIKEVQLGNNILKALGHFKNGIELISCPGCGRLEIDLQSLVEEVERRVAKIKHWNKSPVCNDNNKATRCGGWQTRTSNQKRFIWWTIFTRSSTIPSLGQDNISGTTLH